MIEALYRPSSLRGETQPRQGVLNKMLVTLLFSDYPVLETTPVHLTTSGISIEVGAPVEIERSEFCTAPATLRVRLVKTLEIAQAYRNAFDSNSNLGMCTMRSDSTTLEPITLGNVRVTGFSETANGQSGAIEFVLSASYYVRKEEQA